MARYQDRCITAASALTCENSARSGDSLDSTSARRHHHIRGFIALSEVVARSACHYCTVTPATLATFAHLAISERIIAPNSAAVLDSGSSPAAE